MKVKALLLTAFLILGLSAPVHAYIVLDQDFDLDTTGNTPSGWTVTSPSHGSLAIDASTYYGASGKSARFYDNSASGYPLPYRNFTPQSGLLDVEFALMKEDLPNVTDGAFMLYIDDGSANFNGANVYLKLWQEGVYYYDGTDHNIADYSYDTWYNFRFAIDIPSNTYDIYRNNGLLVSDAPFNGSATSLNRVVFRGTTYGKAKGYLDNLKIEAVPEPVSMFLFGMGLFGFGFFRKKK